MTALSVPATSATAGLRAVERVVAEGLALDAASGRSELVDRDRATEILRDLEAYVDALPELEQAEVSRALVQRFAGAAA